MTAFGSRLYPPKPAHPPLTRTQQRILNFIRDYRLKSPERLSPTYAEISQGLAFKSRGTVHNEVKLMAKYGVLTLFPRHKRGIVPAQEHAITIDFPDDIWAQLLVTARRVNVSPDALVIEALRTHLPSVRSVAA